jgi:hypothetical protein
MCSRFWADVISGLELVLVVLELRLLKLRLVVIVVAGVELDGVGFRTGFDFGPGFCLWPGIGFAPGFSFTLGVGVHKDPILALELVVLGLDLAVVEFLKVGSLLLLAQGLELVTL